jgi:Sec-independent protein secretion pathway component TatC
MTFNIFSRAPKLTAEYLRSNRSYFYVLALIIGACFTYSPSGKEQAMVAVLLMLVFEWTILLINKLK